MNRRTETREELAKAAAAAVDEGRLSDLARDLVRIRSVFEPGRPGGNESEAARFLATTLKRSGLAVTVEEVAPGRPNVIADWTGLNFREGRGRTLIFEGHSDVVTEGDASDWMHPPFEARVVDGRLYGRGSADMKGGIAAAIAATEAVMRTAPGLSGRIRLALVCDEEGMMAGIKSFIANGWAEGVHGAIICEPEENELCLHQKGAMRVEVLFRGAMAHGAMPYAGVNPIPALASYIAGAARLEAQVQTRHGEHRFLGRPWITPTVIRAPREGEQQLNVMPETAYLALDIRTVPGQDHDDLRRALNLLAEEVSREHQGTRIELEVIEERPWTETAREEPLVVALERAYELALKRPAAFGGVPGATDGTFLHSSAGIPIVTVGPGGRTIPHQRDEFVELAALVEAARLYAAAAVEFLFRDSDDADG